MFENQAAQFAELGYAVFEGALSGDMLDLLRAQCDAFVSREDARMDAAGTDTLGISHRGKRYFANECQREQPALRQMLFSPVMADVCRATLGDTAYFFFDQFVVKGPEKGLAFGWHQDSGYMVGNGGPVDHLPYLTCWIPLDDATAAMLADIGLVDRATGAWLGRRGNAYTGGEFLRDPTLQQLALERWVDEVADPIGEAAGLWLFEGRIIDYGTEKVQVTHAGITAALLAEGVAPVLLFFGMLSRTNYVLDESR